MNVGTMRGREGEVVEMAANRHLDFCCFQETGWKEPGGKKVIIFQTVIAVWNILAQPNFTLQSETRKYYIHFFHTQIGVFPI